jgi:hypothetical protein
MIETRAMSLSGRASQGWMRSVWDSVRLGVGRLAPQAGCYVDQERTGGEGMKTSPSLELAWIKGDLVVMGRNQTMKMLIQTPLPPLRRRLFGLRPKMGLPLAAHKSHPQVADRPS